MKCMVHDCKSNYTKPIGWIGEIPLVYCKRHKKKMKKILEQMLRRKGK